MYLQVKPYQNATVFFSVDNNRDNEDLLVASIKLAHPQPQFIINHTENEFGKSEHVLKASKYPDHRTSNIAKYFNPGYFRTSL